jgi:TRAM domain
MVEGRNEAKEQWIARTSQNKVLNFKAPEGVVPALGSYVTVIITGCFPNSLAGGMVV